MRSERRRGGAAAELATAAESSARALWWGIVLGAVLPVTALLVLHAFRVPLGCPGRFVYLYSPVAELRWPQVPRAIVIGLVLGWAVWRLGTAERGRRALPALLLIAAALALGVWTYVAPPDYRQQHVFNAYSPAQDGAFVKEAQRIGDVRGYLAAFPQRARTPPAEMRGTRVISNPPGTTLLALVADALVRQWPAVGDWLLANSSSELTPRERYEAGVGLVFSVLVTALWLVSGVFLYAAGRVFFTPAVAAAFSLTCLFTPATLLFTPGKDPAQLLTVAVPLYLWLRAIRRGSAWAAVGAGGALVLACVVSLVHVWLAAIVAGATVFAAWGAPHGSLRRVFVRGVLPAAVAAGGMLAVLRLACGLDLLATARAVAAAQAEVTRGPSAMPLAWQLLGLPLFLLFAGPAVWAAIFWVISGAGSVSRTEKQPEGADAAPGNMDRSANKTDATAAGGVSASEHRLGLALLLGSAVIMIGTVGFTNMETPRLWIPFVPLLLLGALLACRWPARAGRRVVLTLAALVFVHIAASAVQWSVMDVRESEMRLLARRYLN